MLPDNTSDHVPFQLYLNYSRSLETIKNLPQQMAEIPVSKQKIHWSNSAQEEIIMMYTTPLISELEILNPDVQNVCKNYVKSITKLILAHSQCLAAPIRKRKRNKMTYVSLPTNVKSARTVSSVKLRLIPGKTMISIPLVKFTMITVIDARNTVLCCVIF